MYEIFVWMDIKSVEEGAETKMILRSIAYDNGVFFGYECYE